MSLTATVIALAHTIPIGLAYLTGSRVVVLLTAIGMGFVAAQFGNERYLAHDIYWIVGSTLLAVMIITASSDSK